MPNFLRLVQDQEQGFSSRGPEPINMYGKQRNFQTHLPRNHNFVLSRIAATLLMLEQCLSFQCRGCAVVQKLEAVPR
jgi:hypothetical protein